ncbi:MAG TPA: vitamin K epoxide reductase family protein, partial [Candidatus Saccharimonadales bacterium]
MMRTIIGYFRHDEKRLRDDRFIFLSMLIGAILSLLAAFVLSVESFELAKNPDAVLSCSVNLILNCATVAAHPSSYLFGFPNPFLGLISEPVVITVAIAGLAGVAFPRWFMATAQVFYTLGLIFALYLFYVSMFIIGALCPWCLLVTLTTILVWFSLTRYNIRQNNLYLSPGLNKRLQTFIARDYDRFAMVTFIVLLIGG